MSDTFAMMLLFIEDREQPEKKKKRSVSRGGGFCLSLDGGPCLRPDLYASLYDKEPAPVAAAPVPALVVLRPLRSRRQRRSKRP